MKNDINSITISGNIGKEIEVKTSGSGKSYVRFSLASNKTRQQETHTSWLEMLAVNSTADYIGRYFGKGDPVCIQGEIKQENVEKDGTRYNNHTVFVNDIWPMNQGANRDENRSQAPAQRQSQPPRQDNRQPRGYNRQPAPDFDEQY